MRYKYSIDLYVFLCSILLLGASCKQSEQEDTPVVPATDSEIISYYRSIFDTTKPTAPSAGMYREEINPADIHTQQLRIWKLWKQAHEGWTLVSDFAGISGSTSTTLSIGYARTKLVRNAISPPSAMVAGSVTNQAAIILRATPQRTELRRRADPAPMMDVVMTCVVETGAPRLLPLGL